MDWTKTAETAKHGKISIMVEAKDVYPRELDMLMDDMEKLARRENTRSLQVNLELVVNYKST